jgi:hypothetical protein
MLLNFSEFEETVIGSIELLRVWEDEIRGFKELGRDQVKRNGTSNVGDHIGGREPSKRPKFWWAC